jgi:Tfp pilus assembly PilM family ATPase
MRVLGLDISQTAIACVEMDTAFGRFEIRDTHESVLDQNLDPTSLNPVGAAQQMLASLSKKPDRIVTAVPVEMTTFRNFQIATKDKKAIKSFVEFEIDDDLPFEREDLHYDTVNMGTAGTGSVIHMGAVKRANFENHLNQLKDFQIDPDVITTDAWAYRSLMTRLNIGNDPVMLMGFERNKIFFYIHHKNRPVLYREVAIGVKTIERYLAENMGANQSEIQTWIRDVGVTGIDEQVSNAISDVLELMVPEIKQTELGARATLKDAITQIFVTGEGALMPGFMQWLEAATEKRVSLFTPFSQLSSGQVNYSEMTEIRYAKALALAMTVIPADKLQSINLRKGPFSKTSAETNNALDLIKKPLPYIIITAAVFFATKTIEYNYYKSKLAESDDTLKRAVKTYFGGVSDNVVRTYLSDPAKLKKNVQTDLAKERELSKLFTPNPNSPFDLLKNLSSKIGKDVVIDMIQFDSGTDNVESYKENRPIRTSLAFVVANAQVLARLNELVEKNFNLKRGSSEEITQEGRKLLRITYSGMVGGK